MFKSGSNLTPVRYRNREKERDYDQYRNVSALVLLRPFHRNESKTETGSVSKLESGSKAEPSFESRTEASSESWSTARYVDKDSFDVHPGRAAGES
ncbi:hypothetical protein EVAR_49796_1 [Eumeta japonica]|uniref:Uncharacterized protein n=1 Tax=Eumeta variegata TaxID=151549 RepID=A0A4C1YWX5_EUMVA|nr:hypothetical protein EVAR_49796_1 [Eumeta japonica]